MEKVLEKKHPRGFVNKMVRDMALKQAKEVLESFGITHKNDKNFSQKQYQLQFSFYHTIKKELNIKDD
jgi:hypothetical protein